MSEWVNFSSKSLISGFKRGLPAVQVPDRDIVSSLFFECIIRNSDYNVV